MQPWDDFQNNHEIKEAQLREHSTHYTGQFIETPANARQVSGQNARQWLSGMGRAWSERGRGFSAGLITTWADVCSCLSHQASISDLLSAVLWADCSELRVPASTVQRLYWALIKAKVVIVLLGGERGAI